jgi:ABC-type uncharacterized transport system substrate-binding protein
VIRSSGADPKLAAELIALNVEVMLAAATPAAKAAQSATTKIAIVMADPGDAVQLGLVARLARPAEVALNELRAAAPCWALTCSS